MPLRPPPTSRLAPWLLLAALSAHAAGAAQQEAHGAPPTVEAAPAAGTVLAVPQPPGQQAPKVAPGDSDAELDRALGLSGRSEEPAGAPASLGTQLLQTMLTLALVLGLVYLVLNVGLRKLMGGGAAVTAGGALVSVVARVPLEPRRTLFVLKAAGEYLLVSSSEGGVTLLSKLDTAEAERLQQADGRPPASLAPFLEKLLARRGGPPPEA